jgi:hypothetical protein
MNYKSLPGAVCSKINLLAVLALLLAPRCTQASTAIVYNPGFETGTTGPAGWSTSGGGTFTWVNGTPGNQVHTGSGAVSISGAVAGGAVNMRWLQLSANAEPVNPGEVMQVSAWIKGSPDWDLAHDGYRFVIEFLDSSNTIVGTWNSGGSGVNLLTAANAWGQYTLTSSAAPTGAVLAKLSLFFGRTLGSTSGTPVITFDDVLVTQSAVVANAGFETGTTAPANWSTSGGGTFTWVTGTAGNQVHSGTEAISISGAVAGGAVNMRWLQLSANAEPVNPGEVMQVSAWIKGSSDWDLAHDGYRFVVEFLNASNALVGTWNSGGSGVNLLSAVNTWDQYTLTSTPAPAGAVSAKLSLFFGRTSGSKSGAPAVTFDDVIAYALNLAYPEPIASWTATDIANQETAAQNLIATVLAAADGTATKPTVITVAPGDYRFDTDAANTFLLFDRHYLTIQATGATFWFNPFYKTPSGGRCYGIDIGSCDHVSITGVTVDYTVTGYSQGRVTAINSTTGAITFALDPGFSPPDTVPMDETQAIAVGGKIMFATSNTCATFNRTLLDYVASSPGVVDNSDGTYTVTPVGKAIMFGGRTTGQMNQEFLNPAAPAYVILSARKWDHAIELNGSTNTQLTGVTVYASPQMGISEQEGIGGCNTYSGCSVIPRPSTSRILSSNADAFHSTAMSQGPNIQNCEFGWSGDDLMNIHGLISYVYALDASTNGLTLVTQLMPDLAAPDTIRFYTQSYLKPLVYPDLDFNVLTSPAPAGVTDPQDSTLIAANQYLYDNGYGTTFTSFLFPYSSNGTPTAPLSEFSVDQDPATFGAGVGAGCLAMKRGQIGEGAVIKNNYFHDTVCRGIILNSENGLIESNQLSRVGICSILLAPDLRGMEGPYSRGTIIENNTVSWNGFSSLKSIDSQNVMIGAITVTGDALFGTQQSPPSAEHSNIQILNNQIIDPVACGIFVSDVTTGTVSGNTITDPYYFGTGQTYGDGPVGWKTLGAGGQALYFNTGIYPYFGICVADSAYLTVEDNTTTSAPPAPTIGPFQSYGWSIPPGP